MLRSRSAGRSPRRRSSRLISDGRIHPARIEEIVQKVSKEITQTIYEEGERVLFEVGIHTMSPEAIRTLGRLHFRTSYGQNVLAHSKEVALIAGMIASEVGANVELAKRAALLHDIGKGVEADGDGNHIEVGMDLARRLGEDPKVLNAIGSHHGDVEPESVEAVIVQIADAISAARPGARKETLDNYLKRLENLESIAEDFDGRGQGVRHPGGARAAHPGEQREDHRRCGEGAREERRQAHRERAEVPGQDQGDDHPGDARHRVRPVARRRVDAAS